MMFSNFQSPGYRARPRRICVEQQAVHASQCGRPDCFGAEVATLSWGWVMLPRKEPSSLYQLCWFDHPGYHGKVEP